MPNKSNDIKNNKKLGIKIESSTPNNERYKRKSTKMYMQSLLDQNQKSSSNKFILSKKLFPSRYYFYIIFVKNLDALKKTNCFSKKFSKSYMFITKLLDIYSYFDLIRQFNVFKACFLTKEDANFIESNRKINIGDINFMKNIMECLDNNNYRIFGKIKKEK